MAKDFGTSGDDITVGTSGSDMLYGGAGADSLNGGEGNDVLYGGIGDDTLFGGEGDDQMSGGEGADYMDGGNGNDTYYVDDTQDVVVESTGGGTDTVVSVLSGYTLRDNFERLTLGGTGDIDGNGNALDNALKGNSGNNHLHGRAGNDSIYGYGGDDVIAGGSGNDVMNGGDGTDTITFRVDETAGQGVAVDLSITRSQNTGQGVDTIVGFENLEGTSSSDSLSGNAGANEINGAGGGDRIRGRGGDDDLTGGAGADFFRFDGPGAGNGVDRIRQFELGVDKLVFHTSDGYSGNAGLTFGPTAVGSGPQGIYDRQTGQLFYDADGDGAGAAILLAQFDRGLALTNAEFIVVNDGPATDTPTL